MEQILIELSSHNKSVIQITSEIEKDIEKLIENRKVFVLTDTNIARIYKDFIAKNFARCKVYAVESGENSKDFKNLYEVLKEMQDYGLTRQSLFIAFGGGVIGDLGGLSAGLYMRGIELCQIPTTLLAEVDSSVGGKTAINFEGVKNICGLFYQPHKVLISIDFLKTLPKREIRCGVGEILKTAGLNREIFEYLKTNDIDFYKTEELLDIVKMCVSHKADIVRRDEKEKLGLRKSLNFGHTVSHSLEMLYKVKSHGEYVLSGMVIELEIASKLNKIDEKFKAEYLELIKKYMYSQDFLEDVEAGVELMARDKKNDDDGEISVCYPKDVGEISEIKISSLKLIDLIKEINLDNQTKA